MKTTRYQALMMLWISPFLSIRNANGQEGFHDGAPEFEVATIQKETVNLTQPYVCQVRAHHEIEVRTPTAGDVAAIPVREGQAVKQGDLLFQVRPHTRWAKADTRNKGKVVSLEAPFDGMVGRLTRQEGSLVLRGELLTTLADDSTMWADFNVPEDRYLEYMAVNPSQHREDLKIELVLANGKKFPQPGKLGPISSKFKDGCIAFRADFPNPNHLLRPGQTGTVLISRVEKNAIVIPQQATFEEEDKRFVYVVDKNDVAHQHKIVVQNELDDDLFLVSSGVDAGEKIIIEGAQLVRDGEKVQYEDREPKPRSVKGRP